jgi:HlyD family secretion protein
MTTGGAMDRPIKRSFARRHRRLLIGGGLCAIAALSVVLVSASLSRRSVRLTAANLTVSQVTVGAYHDSIPLQGKVAAHDTVLLDALAGGRVDRVLALPGDMVQKGQPLVALSNSALELDVLEREARLIESVTQLQSYQTSLEQSRLANDKALADIDYNIVRLTRSLGRRDVLAAKGAEPAELKDQVADELAYDRKIRPIQAEGNQSQDLLRRQQLPQIRAQIIKLQQDVVITRGMLDNLVLRAPAAGRLTALAVKVGENRNQGESFGEITLPTGFKIAADVDEYYLGRLQEGQAATVQVGDQTAGLHVARIYPEVKNGVFTVDLDFDGPSPGGLIPGEAVQGKLALGRDATALILPAGAFLERSGGDWVFVVDKDGHSASRRRIKIGRRNSDQVEILGGLAPGDQVVTSDYTGLERIDRISIEN